MAKVLLVDTNFSSVPMVSHLRGAGHDVWICGGNPQAFMAKADPNYIELNYADTAALARLVEHHGFEVLVPGCTDVSYLSCARINDHGRFKGIDPWDTTVKLHNKSRFRAVCEELGLSSPRTYTEDAAPTTPLIVKPVDGYSGRGITVLQTPSASSLKAAVEQARLASKDGHAVIEDHVSGQLHSYSCFLHHQRVVACWTVIEHGSANPFVVDTSHVLDNEEPALTQALTLEVEHLAAALQLKDGLLHGQFIRTRNGFVWVEMTRRCPGDLYSQLIELSTGYRYAANYAKAFLCDTLDRVMEHRPPQPVLRHTVSVPAPLTLDHVEYLLPLRVARWVPLSSHGDRLQASPAGRIGVMFIRADSHRELGALSLAARQRSLYRVIDMEA